MALIAAAPQTKINDAIVMLAFQRMLSMLLPKQKVPITEWVQKNVDLSYDQTSSAKGPIQLYPYQMEPLAETENPDVDEITLCWGQRLGKSTVWKMSMFKRVSEGGLIGLIVYPSLTDGLKINEDTVKPLLFSLPEAKKDLTLRGGVKKDGYHMPSQSSIIYFLGGGAPVLNLTANWTVMDEADFFKLPETKGDDKNGEAGKNVSQIKNIRLRMKTFDEKKLIVCSSPLQYTGTVWKNYITGSRGEWNIRCLHCGKLSPVKQLAFLQGDGHYAGLQWEKDANGDVINDSIRWICPFCRHAHVEADAFEMNRLGEYVHRKKDSRHRSFQCGALGNPKLWSWLEIAQAQEDAIDSDGRKYLSNTVLGMPYKPVKDGDTSVSIEDAVKSKQTDYPDDIGERISIVTAAFDQQKSELAGEKYFPYAVRGWDEEGNSWLLSGGIANSLNAIDDILKADYYGNKIALALIDQGGFDTADDLDPFVASHSNVFYYKGEDDKTLKGRAWMPSENQGKLFLCNAIKYQVRLLELLYDPPRAGGYAWHLPHDIHPDYLQQIMNVGPNRRMMKDGNGEAYYNWCAIGTNRRDYFDAEKMNIPALYIACYYMQPIAFKKKNKPLFVRREWLRELARKAKIDSMKNGAVA